MDRMDSDEEYDRRRSRDKFKRERSDFQDRHAGRREDWPESRDSNAGWSSSGNRDKMSSRSNREYSRDNYGSQRRDRYGSPGDRSDMSPPMKRGRANRDWDERMNYSASNQDYNHPSAAWPGFDLSQQSMHSSGMNTNAQHQSAGPTQPPMLTFKQYLATQDDSVDDMEAVRKYNEYKNDFRRQQISDFFAAHKDEEWFRSRYHPDEFGNRKEEQHVSLKRRLEVFLDLFEKGWIDSVSIDVEKSDHIIRLLDAAVIKLEGGTDFDLQSLDAKTEVEKPKEPELSLFSVDVEKPPKKDNEPDESEEKKASDNEEAEIKKESDIDAQEDGESKDIKEEPQVKKEADEDEAQTITTETSEQKAPEAQDVKKSEEDLEEGEETGAIDDDKSKIKSDAASTCEKMDSETSEQKDEKAELEDPKPKPLHKKDSIFLRNIAPNITKAEIEAMCKKFPGFLRVALADPAPDRKFYRRGWVTFEKLGNIREICWQMTTMKLKDCELGAIVNRDLTRRIRSVNGIASHKNVVRTDIRHAAKIIFNLDKQRDLWPEDESGDKNDGEEQVPAFGLKSRNPLLKNIGDYMIEEANAEEEELLGEGATEEGEENGSGQSLDRDENLNKVLDRDYPNEDEMPNRIGIMHARGAPPSSKVTIQEVNEYIKTFETKIKPFLTPPSEITEEEAVKLGKKDPEKEVEEFIKDNTQKLAEDKWLCPLSGKKFKGPDFVRKHIQNKHVDRLLEVRKECEYFNNYLMDPKRPQLPEHPSNRPQNAQQGNRNDSLNPNGSAAIPGWPHPAGAFPSPTGYLPAYPRGPPLFANPMAAWTALSRSYGPPVPPIDLARFGGSNRGGRYGSRQKQRSYRDLDAPDDD